MRSAIVLLTGFGLLGSGVAVLALDLRGGTVLGASLIVCGLLLKLAGVLLGDPATAAPRHPQRRAPQTLAGRTVERPRAGIPGSRVVVRRRVTPLTPADVVRPVAPARHAFPRVAAERRRAS